VILLLFLIETGIGHTLSLYPTSKEHPMCQKEINVTLHWKGANSTQFIIKSLYLPLQKLNKTVLATKLDITKLKRWRKDCALRQMKLLLHFSDKTRFNMLFTLYTLRIILIILQCWATLGNIKECWPFLLLKVSWNRYLKKLPLPIIPVPLDNIRKTEYFRWFCF